MSDIALKYLSNGAYDLDFDETSKDLGLTDGLENVVLLSLGSFARERALDNVVSNLAACRGGWWADSMDSKGQIGGNMYEAFPLKGNDASLTELSSLAKDSLNWMVDDGIAKSVACSASIANELILMNIAIEKPNGDEMNLAYELNWEATGEV